MTTGQEKWDGRIVPKGRRKAAPTVETRGGKATTVRKQANQLELFSETADSLQRDVAAVDSGLLESAASAVPKSPNTDSGALPTMTMPTVASIANLKAAFEQVYGNKGAPGPDGITVEEMRAHLHAILPKVREALLSGRYYPGLIRRVWIPKQCGGSRGLGIPNVVDRIVSQAVNRVLSPHYESTFHPSSHGFRPSRSCHTAIAEAQKYLKEGRGWVVDLDLEKFFDRIPHDRLIARLKQRVQDPVLIELIHRLLKAKVVLPDGVVVSTEEGAPQGGPLSPLLSNIVLDELDWELAARGHTFVRYADDANIYVRSKRAGERVMASICCFIQKRLRLKVNMEKSAVAEPQERHFLGFRLRRKVEWNYVEVLLSPRTQRRINERIRQLTPRMWGRQVQDCIDRLNRYLVGWINFFSICTAGEEHTFRELDSHIRRRLRCIILRQWKRKRTIVRRLVKLG